MTTLQHKQDSPLSELMGHGGTWLVRGTNGTIYGYATSLCILDRCIRVSYEKRAWEYRRQNANYVEVFVLDDPNGPPSGVCDLLIERINCIDVVAHL